MAERRWYDKDPILKEALDLLKISCDEEGSESDKFMLKMQEQVAGEVIEHIYQIMYEFQGKGHRWYDNDPVMMKAIELLRIAPKTTQRRAALKLLLALQEQTFENTDLSQETKEAKANTNDVANTTEK